MCRQQRRVPPVAVFNYLSSTPSLLTSLLMTAASQRPPTGPSLQQRPVRGTHHPRGFPQSCQKGRMETSLPVQRAARNRSRSLWGRGPRLKARGTSMPIGARTDGQDWIREALPRRQRGRQGTEHTRFVHPSRLCPPRCYEGPPARHRSSTNQPRNTGSRYYFITMGRQSFEGKKTTTDFRFPTSARVNIGHKNWFSCQHENRTVGAEFQQEMTIGVPVSARCDGSYLRMFARGTLLTHGAGHPRGLLPGIARWTRDNSSSSLGFKRAVAAS